MTDMHYFGSSYMNLAVFKQSVSPVVTTGLCAFKPDDPVNNGLLAALARSTLCLGKKRPVLSSPVPWPDYDDFFYKFRPTKLIDF